MVKNLFKGCLTVPNLLSLIRIFLIPAFAVLYYNCLLYTSDAADEL